MLPCMRTPVHAHQVVAMGEGADDTRVWRLLETAEMLARGLPDTLVRARPSPCAPPPPCMLRHAKQSTTVRTMKAACPHDTCLTMADASGMYT